ncbi:MAG: hypothetical protein KatS3mg105_4731 [Gemmatales bacterium]|nr:MAG: hypothetical protein KatS3mg105_4731 [Gemmatales bacterium]
MAGIFNDRQRCVGERGQAPWSGRFVRLVDTLRKWWHGIPFPTEPRYAQWVEENEPDFADWHRQRRQNATSAIRFALFLFPRQSDSKRLRLTIRSILRQTFPYWTLFIVGSPARRLKWKDKERRVAYIASDRLNECLGSCQADFVALIDGGDILAPSALHEVASFLSQRPADLVYTDEDRLSFDGRHRQYPVFKPGWSPEMLLGQNYVGRLAAVRTSLLRSLGGFRVDYGSELDWDLYLRCYEAKCRITHLPRCLYHRSSANAPIDAASGRAVCAYLRRRGIEATASVQDNGMLRLHWPLRSMPLVSIIIPTKDKPKLIKRCLEGIRRRTSYQNLEIILVDNASSDPEVLRYYEQLKLEGAAKIVLSGDPFNYSAACNAGARAAQGEMLLFLNNDTDVLVPDWIEELVRWAQLPDVGVVGTKLLYPNGRIQSAGMLIGLTATMGSAYAGLPDGYSDCFGGADSYRNYPAVTGACQMIPRQVFDTLGGYDESYGLTHSDVEFCFKAWEKGYRVVYTPYARLVHDESATRGPADAIDDGRMFLRRALKRNLTDIFFHHSAWNAHSVVYEPRIGGELSVQQFFVSEARRHVRADGIDEPLDFSDAATRTRLKTEFHLFVNANATAAERDVDGAAEFILAVLVYQAERFHRPLTEGLEGEFCQWLVSQRERFGFSNQAIQHIRKAFAEQPGDRIRRIYASEMAVRDAFPMALTPCGHRAFLAWLAGPGRERYRLTNAEILWFFQSAAEVAESEMLRTYLLQPRWRNRFPQALTPAGWREFLDWVRMRFDIDYPWLYSALPALEEQSGGRAA